MVLQLMQSTFLELSCNSFTLLQRLRRLVNSTSLGLDKLTLVSMMGASAGIGCPDYSTYSQVRLYATNNCIPLIWALQTSHGNPSAGPLGLPYMRPDLACRTFNSTSVEVGRVQIPQL